MAEENIINLNRIKIQCKNCNSDVVFDLTAPIQRYVTTCPICAMSYGIDLEDNPIVYAQKLLRSAKAVKDANISFVCKGE